MLNRNIPIFKRLLNLNPHAISATEYGSFPATTGALFSLNLLVLPALQARDHNAVRLVIYQA